jgi:hypothetical protein
VVEHDPVPVVDHLGLAAELNRFPADRRLVLLALVAVVRLSPIALPVMAGRRPPGQWPIHNLRSYLERR